MRASDGADLADLLAGVGIEHLKFFLVSDINPARDGIDAEIIVAARVATDLIAGDDLEFSAHSQRADKEQR